MIYIFSNVGCRINTRTLETDYDTRKMFVETKNEQPTRPYKPSQDYLELKETLGKENVEELEQRGNYVVETKLFGDYYYTELWTCIEFRNQHLTKDPTRDYIRISALKGGSDFTK